ncbi:MAG: hypothetical protein GF353_09450, partial [Candidatus Lokiarchaeota archaeon]|nr:hypothetical protein [Candidatus Lokiarchaeota archaeon]
MKICPYCNHEIEERSSYCPNCNKPLLVNLNKIYRSINPLNESNNQPYDYDINDYLEENYDNINIKIRKLNLKLNKAETRGAPIGNLLIKKAGLFYQKRQLNTALKILKNALNYFSEEGNDLHLAICHNETGLIFEDLGFFNDAVYHFERAIDILKTLPEIEKLIQVYNNLANIYLTFNDLEYSYQYYLKALQVARDKNLLQYEVKISSNFIDVLIKLKQFHEASEILKRNKDYFEKTQDLYGKIISLNKMGKLNFHLGASYYEISYNQFKISESIIKKLGDNISVYVK